MYTSTLLLVHTPMISPTSALSLILHRQRNERYNTLDSTAILSLSLVRICTGNAYLSLRSSSRLMTNSSSYLLRLAVVVVVVVECL